MLTRKTMILTCLKNHRVYSLVLWLVLVLLALYPSLSRAQGSVVLSVSPTLFEMTANTAQTWQSSIRVINANQFPITVYAEPVNFAPRGEGGDSSLIPIFDSEDDGATLAEWISVTPDEIVIPPEQTVSVPFTISVPADAAPGGHFAAVMIGTRSFDNTAGQAQVETSQVVTSLVFLRVAGDITESGNIREFTTSNSVYERADATFSVRFENTGNVHLQPQGEIEIKNMWGQVRGVIPVNKHSQFGNVLPESIRNYTFHWSSDWAIADIGRHTAEITLAYGENTRQFVDSSTSFWIIPWKLLLLFIFLVGGFLSVVIWGIKLYVRRMLQLAGVTPELQRQTARTSTEKKKISVVAPIGAGILDLRKELREGEGTLFQRLLAIGSAYKAFVLILAAVLVFVVLLGWYAFLVVKNDFSYEVHYEQPDGTNIMLQTEASHQENSGSAGIEVAVINHTNHSDVMEVLERNLSADAYNLKEEHEPYEGEKSRSVLVYDPSMIEQMEAIKKALPGILVSSYVAEEESDPKLTLYVGTDLLE